MLLQPKFCMAWLRLPPGRFLNNINVQEVVVVPQEVPVTHFL